MGQPCRIEGDLYVTGTMFAALGIVLPSNSVIDATVSPAAAISTSKVVKQEPLRHRQQSGSAVIAANEILGGVRGTTPSILQVRAMIDTVATGSDRTVTIDVQRSTGGGAFSSVLTSTLVFDHTATARTFSSATVSLPTLVDGDVIKVTVAVAGSAGNQALGLLVETFLLQTPDG